MIIVSVDYNLVLFCSLVFLAFQIGMPIYIVWAYHSSTDSLAKHTARGRQQEVLVPADTSTMTQIMMTTTATMATATPTPAPTLVASE